MALHGVHKVKSFHIAFASLFRLEHCNQSRQTFVPNLPVYEAHNLIHLAFLRLDKIHQSLYHLLKSIYCIQSHFWNSDLLKCLAFSPDLLKNGLKMKHLTLRALPRKLFCFLQNFHQFWTNSVIIMRLKGDFNWLGKFVQEACVQHYHVHPPFQTFITNFEAQNYNYASIRDFRSHPRSGLILW